MEEQKQEDGKYFHIENITKNIWTTIIGGLLMLFSSVAYILPWFVKTDVPQPEWYHMVLAFVVGFALLFAKDKLVTYIDIFAKKRLDKE